MARGPRTLIRYNSSPNNQYYIACRSVVCRSRKCGLFSQTVRRFRSVRSGQVTACCLSASRNILVVAAQFILFWTQPVATKKSRYFWASKQISVIISVFFLLFPVSTKLSFRRSFNIIILKYHFKIFSALSLSRLNA